MVQDSSFTQSALLVWVCREEGRVEAAVAAGGEKSSHPLCQCRRIWADIFFFPTVESHPTSCMSQLTSSQDLSQSKSAIKPRDSSFSPFYICSFTPGRSLQWPGKHKNKLNSSVTVTQQRLVWSQNPERRISIAVSLEISINHSLTKLTQADSSP